MSIAKPARSTALALLENDRSGDLVALAFAIALAIFVAAVVPL